MAIPGHSSQPEKKTEPQDVRKSVREGKIYSRMRLIPDCTVAHSALFTHRTTVMMKDTFVELLSSFFGVLMTGKQSVCVR